MVLWKTLIVLLLAIMMSNLCVHLQLLNFYDCHSYFPVQNLSQEPARFLLGICVSFNRSQFFCHKSSNVSMHFSTMPTLSIPMFVSMSTGNSSLKSCWKEHFIGQDLQAHLQVCMNIRYSTQSWWYTSWWFGNVWNMTLIFPCIGNVIIPTDFHIFQRGWNHQPVYHHFFRLQLCILEVSPSFRHTGTQMECQSCVSYKCQTQYILLIGIRYMLRWFCINSPFFDFSLLYWYGCSPPIYILDVHLLCVITRWKSNQKWDLFLREFRNSRDFTGFSHDFPNVSMMFTCFSTVSRGFSPWTPSTGHLGLDQMIRCTPNKRHCGGQGGCSGATAELAFQFVKDAAWGDPGSPGSWFWI